MRELRIESWRGQAVEAVHRVSAVVVDAEGRRVAWTGDPGLPTFMRSSAKPLQAMPLVGDGVVDRFGISPRELAVACASHNAERRHVRLVRGLLSRIGCDESDLVCGPHRSLLADLAVIPVGARRPSVGRERGGVFNNCSGKHAGMLALAVYHGWPTEGYERPDHPVQRRCRDELERWTNLPAERIGESTDGCGVVCFHLPLDAMALAFARLGSSPRPEAVAVRNAMMSYAPLVAGRYRLCTEMMQAFPGKVLAKVGAAGVYGAALPGRRLGIALKIEDGDARAAMAGLLAVLDGLGLEASARGGLSRFAEFPVRDTRGHQVGSMRSAGSLTFA